MRSEPIKYMHAAGGNWEQNRQFGLDVFSTKSPQKRVNANTNDKMWRFRGIYWCAAWMILAPTHSIYREYAPTSPQLNMWEERKQNGNIFHFPRCLVVNFLEIPHWVANFL
eukprot:GEMP01073960.1.p2 GENE.GEMP01073960.1~~GEMP01073960.1.p2  ORF type:complete len:111 (-),score=14.47 GEMP01073960.1:81-413(-)